MQTNKQTTGYLFYFFLDDLMDPISHCVCVCVCMHVCVYCSLILGLTTCAIDLLGLLHKVDGRHSTNSA